MSSSEVRHSVLLRHWRLLLRGAVFVLVLVLVLVSDRLRLGPASVLLGVLFVSIFFWFGGGYDVVCLYAMFIIVCPARSR